MNWCKRDKRECIGDICSMRPQPKKLETYEDCPEFAIRGKRSKLNLYYDKDFVIDSKIIDEVLDKFINYINKGE